MDRPICWRNHQVILGKHRAVNVHMFSKGTDAIGSSIFRSPRPLTLKELGEELERYPPVKLQWKFPFVSTPSTITGSDDDDDNQSFLQQSKELYEGMGSSGTEFLTRLSVTMPNNPSGLPFALELLQHTAMPNLNNLELADSFICYEETLNAIATNLPLLEILSLRNTGDLPVTRSFCESFASTIRSSRQIRQLYLSGVQFACQADWQSVVKALRDNTTLEEVSFFRLSIADDASTINNEDYFSKQVACEARFLENRACTLHLLATNIALHLPASTYTVHQRLQALLHVRAGSATADGETQGAGDASAAAAAPSSDMMETLASVADRVDFGYEFLRHHVDPAQWSQ